MTWKSQMIFYKEKKNGHINFKFIGPPRSQLNTTQFGHPFGLHHCMEKATCDYVLLNDPDIIDLYFGTLPVGQIIKHPIGKCSKKIMRNQKWMMNHDNFVYCCA